MITTIIKTNNSEDTLSEVLESVKDLGELIVIDMHSNDDTVMLAKEYKASLVYSSLLEFEDTFNQVISEAQNDWILFLCGSEIVPERLANEILNYIQNPKRNVNAIYMPEKFFYLNKEVKSARKFCLKLFKKGCVQLSNSYSDSLKPFKTKRKKITKNFRNDRNCILNFGKNDILINLRNDLDKITIKLKENSPKRASIFIAPLFKFLYLYILKGAFLDGKRGFAYSFYNAVEEFILQCAIIEKSIKE